MASDEQQLPDEQVILDGITVSQFRLLVDLLAEWISTGLVKIRFTPNPIIEFEDDKILPILKEKGLPENCVPLMKWDISFMLAGILTGSRGVMVNFLTSNANARQRKGKKPPTEKQIHSATTVRLKYVEQKIVTPNLRNQYSIKDKAKTNIYCGTAWEVVRSQSHDDPTIPVGLTYTTLRIDTLKPSPMRNEEPMPLPFNRLRPSSYDSIVLTVTSQDLSDIIDSLNAAVKAIKQCQESEGNR